MNVDKCFWPYTRSTNTCRLWLPGDDRSAGSGSRLFGFGDRQHVHPLTSDCREAVILAKTSGVFFFLRNSAPDLPTLKQAFSHHCLLSPPLFASPVCQIMSKGVVAVLGPSASPASNSIISNICGEKEVSFCVFVHPAAELHQKDRMSNNDAH